ncbi:MAG: hded protein [Candidatus Diapherotrites archaeon]|nr:hded protein [Candidatus Diapherotrites archaeon]
MFGEVKEHWGWMLAVGVFFIALGVAALLMLPLVTTLTTVIFGALAIAAGIFQLYNGVAHTSGWGSRIANIILALLYIGFGVLTFYNPMLGAAAITLAMAATFMAIGIIRAWIAWQNKSVFPQWGAVLLSGIITILLGLAIALSWPASSVWFLGLYVALDLLFSGATFVGLAIAAKG